MDPPELIPGEAESKKSFIPIQTTEEKSILRVSFALLGEGCRVRLGFHPHLRDSSIGIIRFQYRNYKKFPSNPFNLTIDFHPRHVFTPYEKGRNEQSASQALR